MKNITTDDFRFGTFCWSTALTLVILAIISSVTIFGHLDRKFDTTCIEAGKSITYITLDGEDYAHKVCQ